jgi:molybdopterin/thiamine biosynthesis adenylyltransferase
MLTRDDLERYDRQIMIWGVGEVGQEKLQRSKVFIAGLGGLGSSVALYLAVAGVGKIRVVDSGKVELSNLNRQVLYWDNDIGRSKPDSAGEKLKKLNGDIQIETIDERIDEASISQLVSGFDAMVDAMDNMPTRYVLNKAAIDNNIPLFHGAVHGFEGRAFTILPRKTACLWCLYHGAVLPQEKFPVIGAVPAVIGCIQATEVVKYIIGIGELLTTRLLVYDGLNMKFTEFKVKKDRKCAYCGHLVMKE